jgi:hypothetical protein
MSKNELIVTMGTRGLPLAAAMDLLRRCRRHRMRVLLRINQDSEGTLSGQFYADQSLIGEGPKRAHSG